MIIPINTLLSSTTGTKFWLVAFSKSSSIETCMLTALLSLFSFNVRNRNILQLVDVRKIVVLKVPKQVPFSNCSYVFSFFYLKRGMAEYPWNSIFSTTCLSVSSLNICDTFSFGVKKKKKCSLITSQASGQSRHTPRSMQ